MESIKLFLVGTDTNISVLSVRNSNFDAINKTIQLKYRNPYIVQISSSDLSSEEAALINLGSLFKFPDYYGQNWDAFDECISDLSWIGADYYLLIVNEAEKLEFRLKHISILLKLLNDAANYWKAGHQFGGCYIPPTPFKVILNVKTGEEGKVFSKIKKEVQGLNIEILNQD